MSKRYLLIRLCSKHPVTREQFAEALTSGILKHFGDVGLSRIEPKLILFDPDDSKVVVAYAKNYAIEMHAALAFISEIGGSEASALSLKASGTIKSLKS
jgi:RNase P/RNase MRP subunit POP5